MRRQPINTVVKNTKTTVLNITRFIYINTGRKISNKRTKLNEGKEYEYICISNQRRKNTFIQTISVYEKTKTKKWGLIYNTLME